MVDSSFSGHIQIFSWLHGFDWKLSSIENQSFVVFASYVAWLVFLHVRKRYKQTQKRKPHNTTVFVSQYETYHIKGKAGSPLPFVFNDVMGFEKGENGAQTRDIAAALKGLLREGFDVRPFSNFNGCNTVQEVCISIDD